MGRFKKTFILLNLSMLVLGPLANVSAVREEDLTNYAENNILYYDGECDDYDPSFSGIDDGTRFVGQGDEHGHWNGKCAAVGSYNDWLNGQYEPVTKAAQNKGIPWEAMLAQAITESSGFKAEACPFNGLGLKAKSGQSSCDGTYASFNNYAEMWEYYVESIVPVREAKGKYANDPYSFAEFIEYGVSGYAYSEGSGYVQTVSAFICGIQKWAEQNGKKTSAVTYANWNNSGTNTSAGATSTGSADSSSTSTSGSFFQSKAYNMSETQLKGMLNVVMAENGGSDNAIRTEASQMANLFEVPNQNYAEKYGGADAAGLINFVTHDAWYRNSRNPKDKLYEEGKTKSYSETEQRYLEILKDTWNNGHRNIPKNVIEHATLGAEWFDYIIVNGKKLTSASDIENRDNYIRDNTVIKQSSDLGGGSYTFWAWADDEKKTGDPFGYPSKTSGAENANMVSGIYSSVNTICSTADPDAVNDNGNGSGSGQIIADTALKMAWPYQASDGAGKENKCDPDGNGRLVDYDGKYTNSVCRLNPKPAYKEGYKKAFSEAGTKTCNGADVCDCSYFVSTVIFNSGADKNFKPGGTWNIWEQLDADSKKAESKRTWDKVGEFDKGTVTKADLRPGDVLVKTAAAGEAHGHVFIWVGEEGGKWGDVAQASYGSTVAVVSKRTDFNRYSVYRLHGYGGAVGEAAKVPYGENGDKRWKYLFPNGVPTSSSQMEQYLTTVTLNILNERGKKDTMTLRVHKKLADDVVAIFDEMVAIGFKIKKGNTSSYNWRTKRGSNNMSIHSYGVAIDVNDSDNPYQDPSGYKPGVNEYAVTDEVIKIWEKHGFNWGGYFGGGDFDAMHFTYLEKGRNDPNK